MWPMLLDYTRDECKKILRKLELEAYASVISAFRAQGEMSKDKKKMLQELSSALSISLERHRAEVRRAVNDEQLNTIADRLAGPNTSTDWAIEGRRVVPLMPRLAPQTAFTAIANSAANAQATKNAAMPIPSDTGLKENCENENSICDGENRKRALSVDSECTARKIMAVDCASTIPQMLYENTSEDTSESLPASTISVPVTHSLTLPAENREVTHPVVTNSLRTSVTAAAHKTINSSSALPTPKQVIYVSTSNNMPPSMLQKPLNVPVVKTVSTTSASSHQLKPHVSSSGISSFSNSVATMLVENPETPPAFTVSSANSYTTPLISTAGGFTQTITTSTAPISGDLSSKVRPKALSTSKPPVRPRCNVGNPNTVQPQLLSQQGTSLQLPTPNSLVPPQKTLSPLPKSRSSTAKTSPISSSNLPAQNPRVAQTFSRAPSPVAPIPKVPPLPATNPHKTQPPITQKQCQAAAAAALSTTAKSATSTKLLNKNSVHRPPLGARTLLTSVSKPATKNLASIVSNISCSPRTTLQPSIKTSISSQSVTSGKATAVQTLTQKTSQAHNHSKLNTATTKTIQYRNEGGLKIISQNVTSSRILPKPTGATSIQSFVTGATRMTSITTGAGLPGNARIINFSQPVGTRLTRAIQPSSVSSVNLGPGIPSTALRVTLPPGTLSTSGMIRSSTPAKPNVIVVHKAHMWPQTQGTTIVMTSSGPIQRLSSETITNETERKNSFLADMIQASGIQHEASHVLQNDHLQQKHGLQTSRLNCSSIDSKTIQSINMTVADLNDRKSEVISDLKVIQNFKSADLISKCSVIKEEKVIHNKKIRLDAKSDVMADLKALQILKSSDVLDKCKEEKVIQEKKVCEKPEIKSSDSKLLQNFKVSNVVGKCAIIKEEKVIQDKKIYGKSELISDSKVRQNFKNADVIDRCSIAKEAKVIQDKKVSLSAGKLIDCPNDVITDSDTNKSEESDKDILMNMNDEPVSSVSIKNINLDQLQEGQILELQAQDAAELLSQHGQLSREVLELLQQAGLQFQQIDVQDDDTYVNKSKEQDSSELLQPLNDSVTNVQPKEATLKLEPSGLYASENLKHDNSGMNPDVKMGIHSDLRLEDEAVVDIFSSALESAQLDLHTLGFVDDAIADTNTALQSCSNNASESIMITNADPVDIATESSSSDSFLHDTKVSNIEKSELASPLLMSASQPHCDEDVLLVPIGISNSSVRSTKMSHTYRNNASRSSSMENLGDMSTLSLPPGALVVNNVTVEMDGLDVSSINLSQLSEQTIDYNIDSKNVLQ